jgi:hypothetical protein
VRFRRKRTYFFFGGVLTGGFFAVDVADATTEGVVVGTAEATEVAALVAAVVAVVAAAEAEAAAEFAVPAMSVVADAAAADGSVGGVTGSMLESLEPPPQAAARAKGANTKYLRMRMGGSLREAPA